MRSQGKFKKMKRKESTCDEPPTKHLCKDFLVLHQDVLGIVLTFLSFHSILSDGTYLVDQNWFKVWNGDFRMELLRDIQNTSSEC